MTDSGGDSRIEFSNVDKISESIIHSFTLKKETVADDTANSTTQVSHLV